MSERSTATVAQTVEMARDRTGSLDERHAAFTRLVQQSQHIVFGLALASLRDLEDARDASQAAFASAWRRLHQLRDPSAFEPWLKSIVARECARRRRKPPLEPEDIAPPATTGSETDHLDYQSVVASAIEELPEGERRVTLLYYFLGYRLPEIARVLGMKSGTVGKRLHSARLRIRRQLPRSVRGEFVRLSPSQAFVERVRRGLLDEYVGEYRFERRPDHVVRITRKGGSLISESGGQQQILVSAGELSLRVSQFDGEGRFRRNRRGEVTQFVYYEFGKRLGVAKKVTSGGATRDAGSQTLSRQASLPGRRPQA
jgi:RNA polymerase sigma-70 factor (ECF subfamily)